MKSIAIIPARGGSKRIPRKNIKLFLGKPIISYAIELAISSKLFDEIIVSTDDTEIADIARKYGASVPFMRSKNTSDDYAPLVDVIEEVKEQYKMKSIDYICCILPTSPLISLDALNEGFELLKSNIEFDSVRPFVRFSYPIQRAFKLKENIMEMYWEEHRFTRSQDLESSFHDAGQFYWMKFDSGLVGKNKAAFEIPEIQVQDIDTLEDWKLAEFKYSYFIQQTEHKI